MAELTTHQRYHGLSRRFDRRAALLRRLGFTYERLDAVALAVFVRRGYRHFPRVQAIPASTLHDADKLRWIDVLRSVLR